MIIFEKISAKNFLSIGEEPIEITFKKGVSIITGQNLDKNRSNGSGKSTSIESIYFALFGKTIRGLTNTDVVNKTFKKNTEVILTFNYNKDNFKIVRKLKPSKLFLYKNNLDITRDSIQNTQKDIGSIIGVSEDVVKNCIIMGVNQTTPFMAQSKVEKRKFIEGIFDMSIFSSMLLDARSDYNATIKELTALNSKNEEKSKNHIIYKEQYDKFEELKINKINNIKDQINKESENVINYKNKLSKNDPLLKKETIIKEKNNYEAIILDLNSKINNYDSILTKIKIELGILNDKIESNNISGVCPKCKKPFEEHEKEIFQQHIKELQTEIIKVTENKVKLNLKIDKVCDTIKIIQDKINTINSDILILNDNISNDNIYQNNIDNSNENIGKLFQDAKDIKNETNNLDGVIETIEKELKILTDDINKLNKDVNILDQIKFILGENGVKSFVINKLLDIFNSKINYYLDKLNANCQLIFNEFFEEIIINDKKQKCSYFNFSSGERRNIDIAIMFSFMDLQKIQGKFDCNISVYDEMIDGSIDIEGIELVIDILQKRSNMDGKCIYIITHRSGIDKYVTGEIIKIQKENGISKRVMN